MSVEALSIALHHSKATGAAKLVLIGIANHDGDGGAWPSVATLAKYAGVTSRNVQKAIDKLTELGEIQRFIQSGGDHRVPDHRRPNRYTFMLECPTWCDRSSQHRDRNRPTELALSTGVSAATPGVGSDRGGVSVATPKPSLNHPNPRLKKEPSVSNVRASARATAICGDPVNEFGTCLYACSTEFKMRQEQNQ